MERQQTKKRYPQNHGSSLLAAIENEAVFRWLGEQNFTLATGVVQLLAAEKNSRNVWTKKHVGIICLVKDYSAHGYFLRLYDMPNGFLLWEQFMFDEFYSSRLCDELIVFEGDTCVYGLNFASIEEASQFKRALDLRVQALHRNLNKKKVGRSPARLPCTVESNASPNAAFTSVTSMGVVMPSNIGLTLRGKPKGKKSKKRITKEEIGEPTNFEHRVHVGWDPQTGFAGHTVKEDVEPDIRAILEMVNLPTDFKEDKSAVYSVINQFGGVEAVKRDLELGQRNRNRQTSSSVSSSAVNRSVTMNKEDRKPPKPIRKPVQEPPRIISSRPLQEVNVSDGSSSPPPPPPPPPFIQDHSMRRENMTAVKPAVAPPPPPPPPPSAMVKLQSDNDAAPVKANDARADLLAEIRRGKSLKPVSAEQNRAVVGTVGKKEAKSMNGKNDLVNQIAQGVDLKPAGERSAAAKGDSNLPQFEMQGIAGALARALMERRNQITDDDSSDSDEEEEEDEDEWED